MPSFAQDDIETIRKVEVVTQISELEFLEALGTVNYPTEYSDKVLELANLGLDAAQNFLGYCYQQGLGISKDFEKALYWLSLAVENGNIKALNSLGYMYSRGLGVDKDPTQAYQFYKTAALKGVPVAFVNVAGCYFFGEGTAIDIVKAKEWFHKGADYGYMEAQSNLGYIYLDEKDYENALYWYTKAAENGSAYAYEILGYLYENGLGVEKNETKANEFYTISYKKGNKNVPKKL